MVNIKQLEAPAWWYYLNNSDRLDIPVTYSNTLQDLRNNAVRENNLENVLYIDQLLKEGV